MKSLRTEITIDAPITVVWNHLLNFKAYPNWNPFIHIKGTAEVGQQLENTIFLAGNQPQVFKPTVLEVQTEKIFRWKGHLLINGLFDGEHYFTLEKMTPNKTRLIHGENFSGILSSLVFKMIGTATEQGFQAMNKALKERCEIAVLQLETST